MGPPQSRAFPHPNSFIRPFPRCPLVETFAAAQVVLAKFVRSGPKPFHEDEAAFTAALDRWKTRDIGEGPRTPAVGTKARRSPEPQAEDAHDQNKRKKKPKRRGKHGGSKSDNGGGDL